MPFESPTVKCWIGWHTEIEPRRIISLGWKDQFFSVGGCTCWCSLGQFYWYREIKCTQLNSDWKNSEYRSYFQNRKTFFSFFCNFTLTEKENLKTSIFDRSSDLLKNLCWLASACSWINISYSILQAFFHQCCCYIFRQILQDVYMFSL